MPETPTATLTSGFDVDAARKAGVADDDILAHLVKTRNFDVAGALKAGATKTDIIQYLSTTPSKTGLNPGGGSFGNTGASGSFAPYADLTPKKFNDTMYGLEYKVGTGGANAIKGTAKFLYDLATPTANPQKAYETLSAPVKSTVSGITSTPTNLQDFYEAVRRGDYEGIQNSATKLITENAPAWLGAKEFVSMGAEAGLNKADSVIMARAARSKGLQRQNLAYAIQDGIKQGSGIEAAGVYEPYAQSFLKRADVRPEEILPNKGDAITLDRGGSAQSLAKLNTALQKDWVASGKSPQSFVPHKDIHMALAEGAVNEAHAPIANAIRATAGVRIDGSTPKVANIQKAIIDELRAAQDALSPSQHAELDLNYNKAIADVQVRGGTIGGLDSLRRDWNSGMTRFYNGTPTSISNADASSAKVWKSGNNIIRKNLYPVLEDLTERPGATHSLRQAGINESTVLQSQDGIFLKKVQSSNLASTNSAIKNYVDYLTEGRGLYNRGLSAPISTALNYGSRFLGKSNAMGDFNAALRKGLGNFSDFRLIDASAFPKKQITTGLDTSGPIPFKPGQIQNRLMAPAPPPDTSGPIPMRVGDIVNAEPRLLTPGAIPMGTPDTSGVTGEAAPIQPANRAIRTGRLLEPGLPVPPPSTPPSEPSGATGIQAPVQPANRAIRTGRILEPGLPLAPGAEPPSGGFEMKVTTGPPIKTSKDFLNAVAKEGAPAQTPAKAAPAKPAQNRQPRVGTPTPKPPPETVKAKPAAEPAPKAEAPKPPTVEAAPGKPVTKPAPKAPAKPAAKAEASTKTELPQVKTAEVKVGDKSYEISLYSDGHWYQENQYGRPRLLGKTLGDATAKIKDNPAAAEAAVKRPKEPKMDVAKMMEEYKATTAAPAPTAPPVQAETPAAKPKVEATAPERSSPKKSSEMSDHELLTHIKMQMENEISPTTAMEEARKRGLLKPAAQAPAPAPKTEAKPKRAAAPKAPPQPVATRPSMEVLRKRGVVTGDDLVRLASNGDREASVALAKAESLHMNPNDAEALTNVYLNEFDSADLPGDIKDLHARVGRRFTKGK